jgi:hypothetical protein
MGRRGILLGRFIFMSGPPDTLQSYAIPWANASTTPYRWYKSEVHEGGSHPLVIQRRDEGGRLPVAVADLFDQKRAARAASTPARHVRLRPRLVDKNELRRVEVTLQAVPGQPTPGDIDAVLLRGDQRLFLKLSFKSRRCRSIVDSDTSKPRASRNSRSVASGCSATSWARLSR